MINLVTFMFNWNARPIIIKNGLLRCSADITLLKLFHISLDGFIFLMLVTTIYTPMENLVNLFLKTATTTIKIDSERLLDNKGETL